MIDASIIHVFDVFKCPNVWLMIQQLPHEFVEIGRGVKCSRQDQKQRNEPVISLSKRVRGVAHVPLLTRGGIGRACSSGTMKSNRDRDMFPKTYRAASHVGICLFYPY